ncbi:MAG: hypothetical protein KAT25_06460 [Sulfuriflexus sp.]|nr:hypothetical protein [Sulfuriflexus sp.]
MEQQSKKSGMDPRMTIIVMVLVFVVPVGMAIVLHSIGDGFKTVSTTNWGNLVTPVRPIANFSTTTIDNKKFDREMLNGKWTMFYIDSAGCNESCFNNLYTVRQSRLGMGGEKDRVQRVMLLVDDGNNSQLEKVIEEHQGMNIIRLDKATMKEVLNNFEFEGLKSANTAQRIYFIDPLGNLMMHFESDISPRGVVKDLERLLKYSRIG